MRLNAFSAAKILLSAFLVIASSFVAAPQVMGQTSATLSGAVADPTGAAIAHAKITARLSSRRAVAARAESAAAGTFRIELPAGSYRLRIAADSFQAVEQDFVLAAGEAHVWNLRLELEPLSAHVVVSAAAQPASADSVSSPSDVLTRQDIDSRQAIWLAPLLASVPGVSGARLGPFGGITTLFLDGGNSNFTKVLVDGVPVNQPGGLVDFSNYTLDNIQKVEIVHGASSALYGSDAMTGVVQIFTRRGTARTPQVSLKGESGSFESGRGGGSISGLVGRFDYSLGAGYFNSNGQGANDRFRDTTLSGNFGWKFSDTDLLHLAIRSNASDAGQPGQTLLEPPILGQQSDLHNFSADLHWDFSTGPHWQHRLTGYESRLYELEVVPPFGSFLNLFNRAGFEGQSTYLFQNGGVTGGYVAEDETGPAASRQNQAGYFELRYQFGSRLVANAGARAEANGSFGTRVVPRIGANFRLRTGRGFWGATRVRASYGLGIKEAEMLPRDCSSVLKPERSRTVDAGFEQFWAGDRVRFSAIFFHNDFNDIVSFAFGAVPPNCPDFGGSFFNTDAARALGANASFQAKVSGWLSLAGNYTYDDTRVLKSENFFDPTLAPGNRLFRRPLHSANLIANAHFRRMNWNAAGYFVGRRTDSDFLGLGFTSNPSHFRADLGTSFALGRGIEMLARVENLFNRHYQDAIGFPALRLNYRVGMKYSWGGE